MNPSLTPTILRRSRDFQQLESNWPLRCLCGLLLTLAGLGPLPADEPPVQHRFTNDLIHATSPYLLQHAHNPVNWMPWGPAAFEKAKRENKPIFVSIGYSTCYWCHVMERESFEDEQVAKILNERYVAIKVDREQRPDIDEQLMLATQLLTGRGGWPNSVWLTVDGRPWMAGTYFPKQQFMEALNQLADIWKSQAQAVDQQADSLSEAIRSASDVQPDRTEPADVTADPLARGLAELAQLFDEQWGGFGKQPKFPPHGVLRLLKFAADQRDDPAARQMLTRTLDAMWAGGIHDHVGGGFHRYSTDRVWLLPHFEKMLYDNAQLMRAYAEAYELTQDELYRLAVADIAAWLEREMTHPQGGFYSAIDSESDGEEGRYYTWTLDELQAVLPSAEAAAFTEAYHCVAEGNFVEEASGDRPGTNIPFLAPQAAQLRSLATAASLAAARQRLREARVDREYPHLDDKILASWNGLMIGALAFAGRTLEEPAYTQAAQRAAEFAHRQLLDQGQLLRSWRGGQAEFPGYLEDYAFLADGFLELYLTTQERVWLQRGQVLVDEMLVQFEDPEQGGFYFTGPRHETLITRSKNLNGGGNLPVANGVAADALYKLFDATQDQKYARAAERTLDCLRPLMLRAPRQVEQLVLVAAQRSGAQPKPAEATAGRADARQATPGVTAELYVSHANVVAGQRLVLAVVLDVADGYHLYAPGATNSDLVKTTRAQLRATPDIEVLPTQAPAGTRKFDPVLDQQLELLTGRCVYLLPARIVSTPTRDSIDLVVELEYQVCDSKRCLEPQSTTLEFTIKLAEQPEPGRHPEIIPAAALAPSD